MKHSLFLIAILLLLSLPSCNQSKSGQLDEKENSAISEIKKNRIAFKIDSLEKSLQLDTSFGVTFAIYNKRDSSISIGIEPKFDVKDSITSKEKCIDFVTSHELFYGNNIGFIWFVDARLPDGFKKGDKWTPKIILRIRPDAALEK